MKWWMRALQLGALIAAGALGGALEQPVQAAVVSYFGSLSVPTGGTITDANQTASTCARYNASKQIVSASGDCVTGVSATAPIASSGGSTPVISCASCPSLTANQTFTGTNNFNGMTILGTTIPAYVSEGVGGAGSGASVINWYTNESGFDNWRWYINGSYNNGGVGTHTLQLWWYPSNAAYGCCQEVMSFNSINGNQLHDVTFTVPVMYGNHSSSGCGYSSLLNGFLMQWCTTTLGSGNGPFSVSFPVAFSTSALQVTASGDETSNCGSPINAPSIAVGNFSKTGFTAYAGGCQSGWTYVAHWVAVGY